jgi:HK97 family phage major capsid protein
MTIDQVLEKAFTTASLASGGLLNPEQSARFVQGIIDNAVISVEARREPMKANKKQIDKITFGGAVLQKPSAVGTPHTNTTDPTASKVTLDAKEVIVAIDLGYEALEDNIEGNNLFDTILALTSKRVAYDLDQLIIHGDASGGTGTFLDVLDGLLHQIGTNVKDCNGTAGCTDATLAEALKKLPSCYFQNEGDFRFYVSHLARLDYINTLAGKNVNDAFTRYLIEAKEPAYNGIPVRKVGAIKTYDVTGGGVNGSDGILINPKNIVLGVHRDIMFEFERKPRARIIEVTMTMRADVKLEEELACVKIIKMKHL